MAQAFVQGNLTATLATAYNSNVTAGNLLTVIVEIQGATTTLGTVSITDTRGNTWIKVWAEVQTITPATVFAYTQAWYCLANGSGADTVTITATGFGTITANFVAVGEFSGYSGTANLDCKAYNAIQTSSTSIPVLPFLTATNSISFGFVNVNNGAANISSVNSPFSDNGSGSATGNNHIVSAISAAGGSYTLSGTWNAAGTNLNLSIGFTITANSLPLGHIAFVQATQTIPSAINSVAKAYPSNNTAGNFLVAYVALAGIETFSSLTDSLGNVWKQAGGFSTDAGSFKVGLFYAENCKAGANTVTLVGTGGGNVRIGLMEFSGVQLSGSLNVVSPGGSSSGSPVPSGTFSPTVAGALIISAAQNENTPTTWGTTSTSFLLATSAGSSVLIGEYNLSGSSGSQTASIPITSPTSNSGIAAAFFAASIGQSGQPMRYTIASDNFNRANANPIGGNWTTEGGTNALQIVSNAVEASVVNSANFAYWNANTFPNDQWSQVTMSVAAITEPNGTNLTVRSQKTASRSLYQSNLRTVNGNATRALVKLISGTATALVSDNGSVAAADVELLMAFGSVISLFQNGVIAFSITDAALTSGVAGLGVFATSTLANSAADNWSAGGFIFNLQQMMGCGT